MTQIPIVMPWSDLVCEHVLRWSRGSFAVAKDWTIGWNGTHWQVYYRAIDAHYRLKHEKYKEHETFRAAYEWIESLTLDQYETITSRTHGDSDR